MTDSFVFYKSFYEGIKKLPKDERLAAYDAIAQYALEGIEPDGDGLFTAIFVMAKPNIDSNLNKRANGKKGGRPQKEKTTGFENKNHRFEKGKSNEDVNEDVDVNVNEDVNVNVDGDRDGDVKGEVKTKTKPFSPPTIDEIKAYCKERDNDVDAAKFFDYFSTSGWIDSRGKKVKNWKQKIISWEGQHTQSNKASPASPRITTNPFLVMLEEGVMDDR